MDIFSYLKQASRQYGPSGHEFESAEWYRSLFAPLCDTVEIDALFNVIACRKATRPMKDGRPAPRVMLAAHQDEIALLVADILEDGTLRLSNIGGVDPRILPASLVTVHSFENGFHIALPAVVGGTPASAQSPEETESNYKRELLYADLGLPVSEVRQKVHIGDTVTLTGPAVKLLNNRCSAKTMDDRACIGCLLEAAERLQHMTHCCDIYFVATSQEEVGSKGAAVSAYSIAPDLAVALDVSHATIPGSAPDSTVPIDAPSISYGPFLQHRLWKRLTDTADKHGIKYANEPAEDFTWTDADDIETVREGIPTVLIDLPLRYMHTTVETIDMDALKECGRLLAHFLSDLDEGWDSDLWT